MQEIKPIQNGWVDERMVPGWEKVSHLIESSNFLTSLRLYHWSTSM